MENFIQQINQKIINGFENIYIIENNIIIPEINKFIKMFDSDDIYNYITNKYSNNNYNDIDKITFDNELILYFIRKKDPRYINNTFLKYRMYFYSPWDFIIDENELYELMRSNNFEYTVKDHYTEVPLNTIQLFNGFSYKNILNIRSQNISDYKENFLTFKIYMDWNISELKSFHQKHNKLSSMATYNILTPSILEKNEIIKNVNGNTDADTSVLIETNKYINLKDNNEIFEVVLISHYDSSYCKILYRGKNTELKKMLFALLKIKEPAINRDLLYEWYKQYMIKDINKMQYYLSFKQQKLNTTRNKKKEEQPDYFIKFDYDYVNNLEVIKNKLTYIDDDNENMIKKNISIIRTMITNYILNYFDISNINKNIIQSFIEESINEYHNQCYTNNPNNAFYDIFKIDSKLINNYKNCIYNER